MAREFKLPDLGEGVHEGEVLRVLVSPGDEVKEGDPILEVETDKAAVEIPSPFTGKVLQVNVKQGDTVHVGDVMMTFGNGEGEVEAPVEKMEAPARKKEAPGGKEPEEKREKEKEERAEEEKEPPTMREKGPVPASPATRRLARELGVDLHRVTPTGPAGLVTAEDVRSFSEGGRVEKPEEKVPEEPEQRPTAAVAKEVEVVPLPDFSKWGEIERIPLRSIRKATAKQMIRAWSQIPHVHNQDMVDVTKLEEFRKRHKGEVESKGGKLTFTVFALKAAATALKTYPKFNATLDTAANEIVIKHYYHLGVAVNTDDGLLVPVIRDVDRKSIMDLAVELNDMVARARERKVSLEEMQGGTFSITNVGPMGGGYFAPIINYPEVAILGMGAAKMQPVVRERGKKQYEVVPRLMMPIVLCIDHRVLDGADALLFMRVLIDTLEDPDALFMMMT